MRGSYCHHHFQPGQRLGRDISPVQTLGPQLLSAACPACSPAAACTAGWMLASAQPAAAAASPAAALAAERFAVPVGLLLVLAELAAVGMLAAAVSQF